MSRTRYLNKKSLAETLQIFVKDLDPKVRHVEKIDVEESLGRITAEPIFSLLSVPHYHGAAMDGVAVRAEDTFGASEARPVELRPRRPRSRSSSVQPGTFEPVDTGNPLPQWANAVVMIENVYAKDDGRIAVHSAAAPWQHVRLVGEDIVATEPLLPRGHMIRPVDIGALLASGHVDVAVVPRPSVAIIPTGSELVEPGERAFPGNIIEFNSRVIAAFVREWGGEPHRKPRVPDDPTQIRNAILSAIHSHDITVVIAGSSAGEHDYTVSSLATLGTVLVHGIDIMPGKPAICAIVAEKPVLGVPGYPVSATIVCQQVLRPLVAKFLGVLPGGPPTARVTVPRKLPSRLGVEEFVRVTVGRVGDRLIANPLARGAGVITTMVRADGFVRVANHSEGVNAGEVVDVELLRPLAEIENTIVFSGSNDLSIAVLDDHLRRAHPELRISATSVGSIGGLMAMKRGEAHIAGIHLLDPQTGTYNLSYVKRLLGVCAGAVVMKFLTREQGLMVARRNPHRIKSLRDLTRTGIRYVNRQAGSGTRVLLDFQLAKLRIRADRIDGYEREEFTHMAVAVAIASGLADCGMGVRSAATALGLGFVPIEREDYDLVLRRDFAASVPGTAVLRTIETARFRSAVTALGGYCVNDPCAIVWPPLRKSGHRRLEKGR